MSAWVIQGGDVITMNDAGDAGALDVFGEGARITAVKPSGQPIPDGCRIIDASGCAVIPGFVQPHVHLCQTLFRGMAEERALLPWLHERIWPLEGAHDGDSLEVSARLGIAELLLGGTTCILDMGTLRHTERLFQAAANLGIRYVGGKAMMDAGDERPKTLSEDTEQSLAMSHELASRFHDTEEGRLRYAYAPRFILSCTETLMKETAKLARQQGCLLHTHSSENPGELEAVRTLTGKENIQALADLGYTGSDVVLAHCVWLSEQEKQIIEDSQTRIVHCPSCNLKLASGIAPIEEMRRRTVVGIAADGAPCNNRLSAFTEMRSAALLQKPAHGAEAFVAADALRMATRGGAEVLGLQDQVGQLAPGFQADVCVVDISSAPHLWPPSDAVTTLVYSAEASDVEHVMVAGQSVVAHGQLTTAVLSRVLKDAAKAASAVKHRAFGA